MVDLETEEADLPAEKKEPTDSVSTHLKAAGSAAVAKVRGVKLPKPPKPNVSKPENSVIAGVAAIVVASLVVGIGAYFLGKGTGDDVDTARLEGAAAGKQAGAIEGASKGYAEGFQKGRDAGFEKAYIPAYKLNYKRAFEQAGLDAPTGRRHRRPGAVKKQVTPWLIGGVLAVALAATIGYALGSGTAVTGQRGRRRPRTMRTRSPTKTASPRSSRCRRSRA